MATQRKMPAQDDLPSTVRRSSKKAQRTWGETHESAVKEYGEGERAHRTAFASLKHSFEKVGDRWEEKEGGKKGPSDSQAAMGAAQARRGEGESAGGVDASASKAHLMDLARKADVHGRSTMTKADLIEALRKANDRATAHARN